jgi:hypothetical protein
MELAVSYGVGKLSDPLLLLACGGARAGPRKRGFVPKRDDVDAVR